MKREKLHQLTEEFGHWCEFLDKILQFFYFHNCSEEGGCIQAWDEDSPSVLEDEDFQSYEDEVKDCVV